MTQETYVVSANDFTLVAAYSDGIRRLIESLKGNDIDNLKDSDIHILSFIEALIPKVLEFEKSLVDNFDNFQYKEGDRNPPAYELGVIFLAVKDYCENILKSINKLKDVNDPVNKKKRKDELKALQDMNQVWFTAYSKKFEE